MRHEPHRSRFKPIHSEPSAGQSKACPRREGNAARLKSAWVQPDRFCQPYRSLLSRPMRFVPTALCRSLLAQHLAPDSGSLKPRPSRGFNDTKRRQIRRLDAMVRRRPSATPREVLPMSETLRLFRTPRSLRRYCVRYTHELPDLQCALRCACEILVQGPHPSIR